MIRIGGNVIFILYPDGRSVPFEPAPLCSLLEKILADKIDQGAAVARDIVSAVELVLSGQADQSRTVRAEDLDGLVIRILSSAGLASAAAAYRNNAALNGGLERIPQSRIRTFLEESLHLTGTVLDRTAEKVANTMKSIGADESSPALALELAKHFLNTGANRFNIELPDFTPDKECTIRPEEMTGKLSPAAAVFFEKRILKINPVNLKLFPVLRLEVRLTGLADMQNLLAPLTELALAPGIVQAARSADELCLAADSLFRAHGNEADLPAKVFLHLTDASVFSRNWMGCHSVEAQEKCAVCLAKLFASEMTRVPFKLTCT